MKIALRTVELWREVRGPGPRNQSDTSATFSTMKVRSGEKDPTPTGLAITWDQEARSVVVSMDSKDDPVVIFGWENVRRAIPLDAPVFMDSMFPEDLEDDPRPANPGLAAMQKKRAEKR